MNYLGFYNYSNFWFAELIFARSVGFEENFWNGMGVARHECRVVLLSSDMSYFFRQCFDMALKENQPWSSGHLNWSSNWKWTVFQHVGGCLTGFEWSFNGGLQDNCKTSVAVAHFHSTVRLWLAETLGGRYFRAWASCSSVDAKALTVTQWHITSAADPPTFSNSIFMGPTPDFESIQ